MTVWPTVMVTGHRPQHLRPDVHGWVRAELDRLAGKLRDEHGTTVGVSGMALGADLWWADAVVRAGMQLEAHVPFPQQAEKWQPDDQREWRRLLGLAARTVTYGHAYSPYLLRKRNRGMVNASTEIVGVWIAGRASGTSHALRYAVDRGRRPIWVDPEIRRTLWPSVESWQAMLQQPAGQAA
jgi:uncharacterized phage-like protein YoqJ